jgi:hypothetical protein
LALSRAVQPLYGCAPTSEETAKAEALVDALVISGVKHAHVENRMISIFRTLEDGETKMAIGGINGFFPAGFHSVGKE